MSLIVQPPIEGDGSEEHPISAPTLTRSIFLLQTWLSITSNGTDWLANYNPQVYPSKIIYTFSPIWPLKSVALYGQIETALGTENAGDWSITCRTPDNTADIPGSSTVVNYNYAVLGNTPPIPPLTYTFLQPLTPDQKFKIRINCSNYVGPNVGFRCYVIGYY